MCGSCFLKNKDNKEFSDFEIAIDMSLYRKNLSVARFLRIDAVVYHEVADVFILP